MRATMRKMLTLVVVLATLLSLWPVTMTGAVNPPPSSEIETEVWLELSCEGGVGGIRNLSPFPGVEMVKIKVDGKVVGSHPVPLEAGQTMEMAVNWAEWGISLPIVEAHTIVVKTNDDQASATVGPCVELTSPPAPASVVVHKFHDANSNGVQDEGEENIEGWLIHLYSIDGDLALVAEGTTDGEGLVAFTELPPGRYKVWEEKRECWAPTTPVGMNQWSGGYYTVVDLGEGQQVAVEFGNVNTCAPPPPPPEPCIDLEKTGPETAEPGETITYHFWVQNCGDVALEGGAQVYDPLFGDEPIWSGSLQPGEVAEFDMTYTLPEDACGNFTNTAHAVGHPPDQPDVEDEDSWTVEVVCAPPAAPAIDVEKYISTDGETWLDADTPAEAPQIPLGNDVYFRFLVQNVGDVPLTNVGLTDSVYDLSGCAVPEELDPGASFECIIGPFAAEEGEHVNTATACGDYEGQTYKDTDRAKYYGYFEAAPSIDLEKYVSLLIDGQTTWEDADEPPGPQRIEGSEASFKFELTNDGNVPLTDITLEDSAFNLSGCELPEELAPGNSFECVTGPLTLPPGQHTNTGTAIGFYDGIPYTDTDDANTFVIDLPSSIRVTKSATPEELVEPGGEVVFTVVVENISTADTVTITGLTDDVYGDLNGQGDCSVPQELGPGESYECSFTAEVEGNAGEVHTDTVTATGSDDDGNPVEDADDATVTITEGEWDHSSLYFDEDYGCQGDCTEISALVCNGQDSENMEGPTTWELYWIASGNPKDGTVIASGTIEPLDAGECQLLTYNPQDNPNGSSGNYMFKAYQRPGHPGTGELWSEACELECEAVVYVVIAVDTEADNNHPMDAYNTVFDTHNYQRPSAFCPSYETKYSADGTSWTAYTDGTVFNFQVKPTGEEESVTAFTCGDNNAYGLDDYHRAVQFTVPDDGFYDVQVQISYVGNPPDTHIYVVPDDGSGNPNVDTHLSEFLVSTATVANGEYNTIAENLYLEGNTPYWWYAERQSWGNNSNQFAVYRGVGGGGTTISRVMDVNFRTSHTDSFGNPFNITKCIRLILMPKLIGKGR